MEIQAQTMDTQETQRLAALHQLEILDTPQEPEFDELVRIAAAICGAPISVISFIAEDRQWFKATVGLETTETRRDVAFCNHTIRQSGMLLVEDTAQDPRFAKHPMVTADAGLRFYAGIPVSSPDGQSVGTLCVLDRVPRTLTAEQSAALRVLASQINTRLELRLERRALEQALIEAEAAKARLRASEQRFQAFMDSGPFLSYLKDGEGRMLYYNQPMAEQFDVSREFLLNKTDDEVWPASIAEKFRRHDAEVLRSGTLHVVEEETRDLQGKTSMWRSYKFPCPDADGRFLLGGVSIEVTEELRREAALKQSQAELQAANKRLSELASVDALTGLANRRVFDERLRAEFRAARRKGQGLSLLLVDVDNFKSQNDRYGHQHGDTLLRQLGNLLQRNVRPSDLAARYGGEEFAIILLDTRQGDAALIADRLLRAVRNEAWPQDPLTVSIGLHTMEAATPDAERLLTLADEALYAAKHAGKDRVFTYTEVYERALAAAQATRHAA